MATENDYKQTVYYLTKLLNGGLLGEKSCTPIRTAFAELEQDFHRVVDAMKEIKK